MVHIRVVEIKDEVFQDYKKPSMLIGCIKCDWKCCLESNIPISTCHNSELCKKENIKNIDDIDIVNRYTNNKVTSAIIFAGLEPMLQFCEIISLIGKFRESTSDDIVIYTGYYKEELEEEIKYLSEFNNIIIKFGRFIPNDEEKYDDVLGVKLSSKNQYGEVIN